MHNTVPLSINELAHVVFTADKKKKKQLSELLKITFGEKSLDIHIFHIFFRVGTSGRCLSF